MFKEPFVLDSYTSMWTHEQMNILLAIPTFEGLDFDENQEKMEKISYTHATKNTKSKCWCILTKLNMNYKKE